MSSTLPTGSSYGSRVLTSGDLSVRSLSARNKYTVHDTQDAAADSSTSHLAYVADPSDDTVTECSRLVSGAGGFSAGALATVDNGVDTPSSGIVKTFKSEAESTTIYTGEIKATFQESGLSFDSDDCAMYFGKDRVFRIMFIVDEPARLVFQCLNAATGEYVTKFSCAKT